jgi:hypothetical protein
MGAGGRLGGRGDNHVTGAHAAWAARRSDVRRGCGQWRAAVGSPVSGNWPPGSVQTLVVVTHSGIPARHMDRWVRWCLGVCARRAYGHWRGTRARRRVWARSGVLGQKQFAEGVFKIAFLQFFKLKCILGPEAKLKIRHSSTTFTKVGRGLVQAIEQERHANLTEFSVPVNSRPGYCFAIFTLLHSNSRCL